MIGTFAAILIFTMFKELYEVSSIIVGHPQNAGRRSRQQGQVPHPRPNCSAEQADEVV